MAKFPFLSSAKSKQRSNAHQGSEIQLNESEAGVASGPVDSPQQYSAATEDFADEEFVDEDFADVEEQTTTEEETTGVTTEKQRREKRSRNGRETSLRLRLLQTVLPVVLTPLLIAGLVGYRLQQQRTEIRIQEQLKNQALLTSESAVAVIDELLALPETIASSPLVINEALSGAAEATSAGYDTVLAQSVSDSATAEIESEFETNKLLRVHTRLNTYLKDTASNAGISEILVTEANGLNVAYSQIPTDFVQSDEVWWQKGKEAQQWISPPDFDYAAKGFTMTLAQAIIDPANGEFAGVVRAVLPTRKFSLLAQHLQRTGISGSQRVQLIDGDSLKVIDTFSPQGFREGRDVIGGDRVERLIAAFADDTAEQDAPMFGLGDRVSALSADTATDLDIAFSDDVTTVMSFVVEDRQYKLANIPGTQWVAITSMETGEIAAAARDSLLFLTLTTLLLAGVTTAFIFWLARQLSAPISTLAAQTGQVARGNFETLPIPKPSEGGTQETRALTRRFNDLTVRVQNLLKRQEIETEKAQLFAAITGAQTNAIEDLKPLLDSTLPEAREILRCDRLLFIPVSQYAQLATEATRSEVSTALSHPHPTRGLDPSLFKRTKINSPAVAINDVRGVQHDLSAQSYLEDLDVRAILRMPVFKEDQLFGFLIAHRNWEPIFRPWSSVDTHFITQLSAQLKLVVDRIAALQAIQSSQRSAQASRQAAAALTAENQQQSERYSQSQARLQQQVAALIEDIQGVAAGDLTIRAQAADGELETVVDIFNLTLAQLQSLVQQVKQATEQVNTFLTRDEAIATQLAGATHSQQQEAEKTLQNVRSMGASMGAIAEDAQKAASTAKMIAATVETSETGMTLTETRIQQLSDASTLAVKQLEGLGRSGHHIAQVTEMIRDIASETMQIASSLQQSDNPQSLTEKIDRLASRTLQETTLIDSFVNTLEQRSEQVADSIEQINLQVLQSSQLVQDSRQSIEEVAIVAKQFDRLAHSISTATESQAETSDVVANLVQKVITLSDQTATFSQEMESALSATLQTAQTLENSVHQFKVNE